MLRGYLILIRIVAVIVISILASLFLEHTVFCVFVATDLFAVGRQLGKLSIKLLSGEVYEIIMHYERIA